MMKRSLREAMLLLAACVAGCEWQPAPVGPTATTAAPIAFPEETASVLQEVLGLTARPSNSATLAELGADELDLHDVVVELESRHSIAIADEDLVGAGLATGENWKLLTAEDLAHIVVRRTLDGSGPRSQLRDASGIVGPELNDSAIGLQMWWSAANDNLQERLAPDILLPLPAAGSAAVFAAEQTRLFRVVVAGDRRSSGLQRLPAVTLARGQRADVPSGPMATNQKTGISVEAELAHDRQHCLVRVLWATPEDGSKTPEPIAVNVPAGATLLVNTKQVVLSSARSTVSLWDRLWSWGSPPPRAVIERMNVYLLMRPRLTPKGERKQVRGG